MTLGDRIEEAIAGSGKSKAQVARECSVSSGAVSQWLSGETKSLKGETAIALEQATGYRAYWILHGKGPKKANEPVNAWPFPKVPIERFMQLEDADKGYVQRRLLQAIEECEGQPSGFSLIQSEIEHPPEEGVKKFPRKHIGKYRG